MAYDDHKALTDYIFAYCSSFKTPVEKAASRVVSIHMEASFKEQQGSVSMAQALRKLAARDQTPEVEAALADGFDSFRERVTRRLLANPLVQEMINRCPTCQRILRTPKARQCFECGHDWHERAS